MAARKYDVVVVGAGPVGSYVAALLADQGHDVVALDRKRGPGADVCCTGIVGAAYLELLDLPEHLVHHRPRGARLLSPSGRPLRLEHDAPVSAVLDRSGLERALVSRGLGCGAEFQFNATVMDIAVEPDEVCVHVLRDGRASTLTARAVVLSPGHGPELLPRFGLTRVTEAWIGAQVEVSLNTPAPVTVFTDQTLAPGGFAWLVPTRPGRALAGLVARRLHDRRLRRLVKRLRQDGLVRNTAGEAGVRTIPLRALPRTVADRVLVVGAAAGQVKPTTGGGLYYGALCARIAARVLCDALHRDAVSAMDLEAYDRQWRARLGRELAVGRLAHAALETLNNAHLERLFSVARKREISTWVRALPAPAFDWHGRLVLDLISWVATADSTARSRTPLPADQGVECSAP